MKTFKPYTPEQLWLLPPALQDWRPEGHLALFISDGVDEALDLPPMLATDETGDGRGQPPDHPVLCSACLTPPAPGSPPRGRSSRP